ncbi:MAG: hypothetical protein U0174_18075 [Polyangiaceae bacterium]
MQNPSTIRNRRRTWPAVFVLLGCFALPRGASADDEWLGKDKALHFSASALIAGGTYAATAPFFKARYPPLLIGAGVTLAVGGIKEGIDATGAGDPSWRDFTWDVIGAAAGLLVAWLVDVAIRGVNDSHPAFGEPAR